MIDSPPGRRSDLPSKPHRSACKAHDEPKRKGWLIRTGIRQRGARFQAAGIFSVASDPAIGQKPTLMGRPGPKPKRSPLRDGFRKQAADHILLVRTNVTLRVLWPSWSGRRRGRAEEPAWATPCSIHKLHRARPRGEADSGPALAKLGQRPYAAALRGELGTLLSTLPLWQAFRSSTGPRGRTSATTDARTQHPGRPWAASTISAERHAVLSSAYAAAVRWGWDPRSTPWRPRRSHVFRRPIPTRSTSQEAACIWGRGMGQGTWKWGFRSSGRRS